MNKLEEATAQRLHVAYRTVRAMGTEPEGTIYASFEVSLWVAVLVVPDGSPKYPGDLPPPLSSPAELNKSLSCVDNLRRTFKTATGSTVHQAITSIALECLEEFVMPRYVIWDVSATKKPPALPFSRWLACYANWRERNFTP